jgi:hypothetical protein
MVGKAWRKKISQECLDDTQLGVACRAARLIQFGYR